MKERIKLFKKELDKLNDEMDFLALAEWFQEWAIYIAKGGVRPGHPH